jgi:hypothetical protein
MAACVNPASQGLVVTLTIAAQTSANDNLISRGETNRKFNNVIASRPFFSLFDRRNTGVIARRARLHIRMRTGWRGCRDFENLFAASAIIRPALLSTFPASRSAAVGLPRR